MMAKDVDLADAQITLAEGERLVDHGDNDLGYRRFELVRGKRVVDWIEISSGGSRGQVEERLRTWLAGRGGGHDD